jgi:hypothetical protein
MESLESLLRAEFDPPTIRPRGSVSELIATTRRLRRRRTAGIVTVVASLVLAIVASVMLAKGGLLGRERAANQHPGPTVVDPSVLERIGDRFFRTVGLPLAGGFVDDGHGYLLVFSCTDASAQDCRARLRATTDGGVTFTDRPVPSFDGLSPRVANVWVFDASALVFDAIVGRPGEDSTVSRRWASADGGLTWRSVPTAPAGPIAEIPAGAMLVGPPELEPRPGPPLVLTADGTTYTLATAPAAEMKLPNFLPRPNRYPGAHFLTGTDGRLFVSTDRGASWQPADTGGRIRLEIIGGKGDRVFGVLEDDVDGSPSAAPNLYVSDDRGRTWTGVAWPALTPVVTPSPGAEGGVEQHVDLAVLPTGGVLLADRARLWRLPPGGDRFDPVATDWTPGILGLDGVVLGLRGTTEADVGLYLTIDGDRWQRIDMS